jgi:hypothetical protein
MTPNARQESKNNDETKQPTRENNSIADKRIVSLSSFHSIADTFCNFNHIHAQNFGVATRKLNVIFIIKILP